MKRFALVLVLVVLGVLVAPVAPADARGRQKQVVDEPEWFVDEESLPFEAAAGFEDSERMWGVYRGAGYRIEVPANWNGDLIMWTHGYRGEDARLYFNADEFNPGFRAWILEQGYAWAASTYAKNSYNVTQAVRDTHSLSWFAQRKIGRADKVYVAGYSMGGHIAAVSAEWYGRSYDGAMPMCGVVGDYELFDYFLDVAVVGQQLALGTSAAPADDDFLTDELPQIQETFGMSVPFAFNLTESGEQFKQFVELESGGDRPNFDEAFNFWFSIGGSGTGTPGAFLYELGTGDRTVANGTKAITDNTDAVYQVDLDPAISDLEAQLNADVVRVAPDPGARSRLIRNPPPVTGKLRMPVLTMHNLGDLFVPYEMEIEYAKDAAKRGKSHLLVQRAIRGVSHCEFTDAEMIAGMSDLITWVEDGIRPEGDVILDPAAVADPNYGCRFTDGPHFLGTPCP